MKDIILIDKPAGITSFDVIRKMRKKLGVRKIGHAGTLDPLATGLLILGVGEGTKKLKEYLGLDKEYEFEIILGRKTDTADLEGKVLEDIKVEKVEIEKIKKILKGLIGKKKLRVPKYSAIKVGGERLYKKARKGENFEAPEKLMEIKSLELLDAYKEKDKFILKIRGLVGSGTYIRSIVEKVGDNLGIPATARRINRTKIGNFNLENAEKLMYHL